MQLPLAEWLVLGNLCAFSNSERNVGQESILLISFLLHRKYMSAEILKIVRSLRNLTVVILKDCIMLLLEKGKLRLLPMVR